MARFEEVLPALREGRKIRQKRWQGRSPIESKYVITDGYDLKLHMEDIDGSKCYRTVNLTARNLLADDWEIVP